MLDIQVGITSLGIEDRIAFFRTLSSWLQSGGGMAVAEAVKNTCDGFSRDEYKTLKSKMDIIVRAVQSGQTPFYMALRDANIGFQRQELAILEASEKSNQLKEAVPSLVEALDTRHKSRKALVGKLTMPLIGGFALILMSLGVLIVMMPTIMEPTLKRNPEALYDFPSIIRFYWYASVWLRANWLVTTIFGLSPVILMIMRFVPAFKPIFQRTLVQLPITKKLIINFNAMVVVYFMPALLRSGMPTHQVLDTLADCVDNISLANILRTAAQEHEGGVRMSDAVQLLPFRTSFVNAVHSGELTGAIADRVADLKEPYTLELTRQIGKITKTLMTMVMAVLLPLFMISTYTTLMAPIFALMNF